MRSDNRQDGQKRSFIEMARRSQIITAAIDTIAEHGYTNASLARIAQHAGISKGVISYHFAGKEELMDEVVQQILAAVIEEVAPRVAKAPGPREALREHIIAVGEYIHGHRPEVMALGGIFNGLRTPKGWPKYGVRASEPIYESLELYFQAGQDKGVFRHFDTKVMAVTLQSSLDGAFAYWVANPGHDLPAHIAELAAIMDRAVITDAS